MIDKKKCILEIPNKHLFNQKRFKKQKTLSLICVLNVYIYKGKKTAQDSYVSAQRDWKVCSQIFFGVAYITES